MMSKKLAIFPKEEKSISDLILQALFREPSLNTNQLQRIISNETGKSIKYKTIWKHLNSLLSKQIIVKQDAYRNEYSINPKWLNDIKTRISNLELILKNKYEKESKFNLINLLELTDQESIVRLLNFKSLADFNQMIFSYLKEVKKSPYSIGPHLWFPVLHPGEVIDITKTLKIKNEKIVALTSGKTKLDEYCARFFKTNKGVSSYNIKSKWFAGDDIFMIGDAIFITHYPAEMLKKFETVYQKSKDPSEIRYIDFIQSVLEEEREIPVLIVENGEITKHYKRKFHTLVGSI